ncbi:hypothetical protein [Siccibacter turicensis]|uniref:hypothetical protein n=1 Tax=Siccibacter turicensis TaxID=357233 RepID=UPI000463CD40|nr:hypothetical protein [Siccibacter turicensis]
MPDIFENKRKLLYRKAQNNVKLPQLHLKLKRLLVDEEVYLFLSLSETDGLINYLSKNNVKFHERCCFSNLKDAWGYINKKVYGSNCYLYVDTDWKYCGAVALEKGFVLSDGFDFDEVICDELRFFSREAKRITTVDYSHSKNDDTYTCTFTEYQ